MRCAMNDPFRREVESRIDRSNPRFAGALHPDAATERAAEEARARVVAEIARLGLEDQVGQLERDGYAIVPPDKAAPPGFADRLRDAVLAASAECPGNDI